MISCSRLDWLSMSFLAHIMCSLSYGWTYIYMQTYMWIQTSKIQHPHYRKTLIYLAKIPLVERSNYNYFTTYFYGPISTTVPGVQ